MKKCSIVAKILMVGLIGMLGVWLAGCSSDSPTDANSAQPNIYAILAIDDVDIINGWGGIGTSDVVDLTNVQQWLADIQQNTGFPTNIKILKTSDGSMTGSALAAAIAGVKAKVAKNDVVLFWYSGHGLANENPGGSKWPLMAFLDPARQARYTAVDFNAAVIGPLKASGAKLVIAAADCCNNLLSQGKLRRLVRATSENYATLFKQKGSLVMAGAIRGEVSYGSNAEGGQFTAQFLKTFYENVASTQPSWQTILTNATQVIVDPYDGSAQHPQGELDM